MKSGFSWRGESPNLVLYFALLAIASGNCFAEGYREFPCIECDGYDYGWKNAAEAEFTEIEDCDYEADDKWSRDYVEGCLDYVNWKRKRDMRR